VICSGISQNESQDLVDNPKGDPKNFFGISQNLFWDIPEQYSFFESPTANVTTETPRHGGSKKVRLGMQRARDVKNRRTTFTTFTRRFDFMGSSGEYCKFATLTNVHLVHH